MKIVEVILGQFARTSAVVNRRNRRILGLSLEMPDRFSLTPQRLLTQVDGLTPYAANLCPLSGGVEFAGFRENFGESIGELIEAMLQRGVRQRTAEHLEGMLSEQ